MAYTETMEKRRGVRRVKFREVLDGLRETLQGVPEHRTGQNTQYEIADAGLGAFSVFCV